MDHASQGFHSIQRKCRSLSFSGVSSVHDSNSRIISFRDQTNWCLRRRYGVGVIRHGADRMCRAQIVRPPAN